MIVVVMNLSELYIHNSFHQSSLCLSWPSSSSPGLVFLHQIFLTEALRLNPDDPYSMPYRYSVEAVMRCSARILRGLSSMYFTYTCQMAKLSSTISTSMLLGCVSQHYFLCQLFTNRSRRTLWRIWPCESTILSCSACYVVFKLGYWPLRDGSPP